LNGVLAKANRAYDSSVRAKLSKSSLPFEPCRYSGILGQPSICDLNGFSQVGLRPAWVVWIRFLSSSFDCGSRPMRRLSATDMPATLAASTCVLVFAMCFFSLGTMTRYLASRALKRQTNVLARGLREAVTGTRHELEQLPPIEALNCPNGTSDVLAQRAFDNPYVRWIGIRQAGEMICRSGS